MHTPISSDNDNLKENKEKLLNYDTKTKLFSDVKNNVESKYV